VEIIVGDGKSQNSPLKFWWAFLRVSLKSV